MTPTDEEVTPQRRAPRRPPSEPALERPHATLGEQREPHTRLLKCALEIDACRAYWGRRVDDDAPSTERAFEEYWFGSRSLARVQVLLSNLKLRFDAYPDALRALHLWSTRRMSPETRRTICHWHLQLADPLYRRFTGELLPTRLASSRPEITRDVTVRFVADFDVDGRWTLASHVQFASKLLSAAHSAGLLERTRDPRPIVVPRVPDEALEYFVQLLRELDFAGTLTRNPYFASVGLDGPLLEERLRALPNVRFDRQGDLVDLAFRYPSLRAWADARFPAAGASSSASSASPLHATE